MLIREAVPEDAGSIATVHVASWRTTYRDLLPASVLANLSVARREAMWQQAAVAIQAGESRSCLYVAEDAQGRIIGFANAGPEREDDVPFDSELYAIYLLEEHQGKGLGRQLVGHVVGFLLERGWSSMRTWVLKGNPAEQFYQRLGGQHFTEKETGIAGVRRLEIAYGWRDIRPLS